MKGTFKGASIRCSGISMKIQCASYAIYFVGNLSILWVSDLNKTQLQKARLLGQTSQMQVLQCNVPHRESGLISISEKMAVKIMRVDSFELGIKPHTVLSTAAHGSGRKV